MCTRSQILALALLFSFTTLSLSQINPESARNQESRVKQNNPRQSNGEALAAVPIPIPVRIIKSPEEERHDEEREANSDTHDAADLDAQVRSAQAGERQVFINIASLLLSAVSVLLLLKTFAETRKATKAAVSAAEAASKSAELSEKEFFVSQRAYVFARDVQVFAEYNEGGQAVKQYILAVEWENNGNTPAAGARSVLSYTTVPVGSSAEPVFDIQEPDPHGIVIGRGARIRSSTRIPIETMDIAYSGTHDVYIYIRIEYSDIFDPKSKRHFEQCCVVRFKHDPRSLGGLKRRHVELQIVGSLNSFS